MMTTWSGRRFRSSEKISRIIFKEEMRSKSVGVLSAFAHLSSCIALIRVGVSLYLFYHSLFVLISYLLYITSTNKII